MTESLERDLARHLEREESVVFSFVDTHIPKLEPLTEILRRAHENVRRSIRALKAALEKIASGHGKEKQGYRRIRDAGSCLMYRVRDMLLKKRGALYRIMEDELKEYEKRGLAKKIRDWEKVFRRDGPTRRGKARCRAGGGGRIRMAP